MTDRIPNSKTIPIAGLVDVSELDMNETLQVADLQVPEGIEVLADPEDVLCSVLPPRKVEAEEGADAAYAVDGEKLRLHGLGLDACIAHRSNNASDKRGCENGCNEKSDEYINE
jgi:hypothetical protein